MSWSMRLPWNWRPSAVSGMRAIAVDYSGASGAPCLLAVADRIVDEAKPFKAEKAGIVGGVTFEDALLAEAAEL